MANSLFAEFMIPKSIQQKVCNEHKDVNERGVALLDCVESRLEVMPSDLTKVVDILESEPFLRSLADRLVDSYCE